MTAHRGLTHCLLAALLALALLSCGEGEQPGEKTADTSISPDKLSPLKLALLPIVDVLPFYLAEEQGWFAEAGVEVTAVPVSSALERDQLLQSGEVDGMLGELAAASFFNREETRIRVVMTARKAYPGAPIFRILAAPGSSVSGPSDLAGVPIAISENTIIEYITHRLLQAEGLKPDEIVSQSVPAIPERYQLLMEGRIKAATLPDPLAQSAVTSGAVLVLDDAAHPKYAVTILAFRAATLSENPVAVRRFLEVWNRAARTVNADPAAYRALLLSKIRVPENVQESFAIPPFPTEEIPSPEQWGDVVDWLLERGLIDRKAAYAPSVTGEFLSPVP
jgi:NitT/TauT family transport system substrate-binding protein